MAVTKKTVYVCFNEKGETLYNKVLGTWNDGKKGRDNSSVWTFSARKDYKESETIQRAVEWLEKMGYKNLSFGLREVELVGKKWRIVVDEVPFGEDTTKEIADENAGCNESELESQSENEPLSEDDVTIDEIEADSSEVVEEKTANVA